MISKEEAVPDNDHPLEDGRREEFMMVPIERIIVKDRIRTDIDKEGDSMGNRGIDQ
jgi:hypothetical protein